MPQWKAPKYKPEFCQMIIDHMSKGYSIKSFAGVIEVSERALYDWFEEYPDFRKCKEIGSAKSRLVWEEMGLEGLHSYEERTGKDQYVKKNMNAVVWIFNMKNRFNWKDKAEIDASHSGAITFESAHDLNKPKPEDDAEE